MNIEDHNEEKSKYQELDNLSFGDEDHEQSIEPQLLIDVREELSASSDDLSLEIQDSEPSDSNSQDLESLVQDILTVEKEFEKEVQIQPDTEDQDRRSDTGRNKKGRLGLNRKSSSKEALKNKLKTNENELLRRLNTQNRL